MISRKVYLPFLQASRSLCFADTTRRARSRGIAIDIGRNHTKPETQSGAVERYGADEGEQGTRLHSDGVDQKLVERDRQFANALPGCVIDGVCHGSRRAGNADLTDASCAIRRLFCGMFRK